MAGPVIGYAVTRIGDFLIEEALFLRDVDEEVRRLRDELQRMVCFLEDADAKRRSESGVENWVKQVREVAYRAEDLVESYVVDMEKRKQRRRSFIGKFTFFFHLPGQLRARHNFGREIELLWRDVEAIERSRQTYGIRNLGDNEGERYVDEEVALRRRAVLHADDDSDVVGMEDAKEAVSDLLFLRQVQRRSVVSIVGMGGLGKTTLAKKVYKDLRISSHFRPFWVNVSQHCRAADLLKDLVAEVKKRDRQELENMTESELGRSLHQSLKGSQYLIVMDDVWETRVWQIVEKHLPDDGNGSRILITTRFQEVAEHADPLTRPYFLRFLSPEESRDLFLRKAFPGKDGRQTYREGFEEEGNQIIAKCGGLPLALVVIGGLLSKKKSVIEWGRIRRTLVWQHQEGEICMQILALSYAHLPQHLKWCFLYLGAFPEDFEIDVQKLIRLWIAEGFVEKREDITLEESAELYLEELVQRCLVQVEEWSPGNVEQCRIHDLLHELAIKEAKELNFFHLHRASLQPTSISYSSLRRLSLHTNLEELTSPSHSTPRLRTLLGFNLGNSPMSFPTTRLQLIRVIDLEKAQIARLPKEIGDLANLRYLGLRGTQIKSLPASLQKLSRLQSLDVRETRIAQVNHTVWGIEALRQVLVSPHVELRGIHQNTLTNLQVLQQAKAGVWINNCLSGLTNLQILRLASIDGTHHRELSAALHRFSRLTTLQLVGKSIPAASFMLSNLKDLHWVFLSGQIQRPQDVNYQWPSKLSTLFLTRIGLERDPMPSLGELCDLRVLILQKKSYCGEEITCPENSFPQLRICRFEYVENLKEWRLDNGAMPRLKKLRISGSRELTMLPQGLMHMVNLEELFLLNMSSTLYARLDRENGEDWKNIRHIPSITIEHVKILGDNLESSSRM